jgi:hypothetical protein
MLTTSEANTPRSRKITAEWNELSQDERECLIAVLLNSITDWHAWSSTDMARLGWLERQFNKAGIPFRSSY